MPPSSFKETYSYHGRGSCDEFKELVTSLSLDIEEMDAKGEAPSITLGIEGVVPPCNPHGCKSFLALVSSKGVMGMGKPPNSVFLSHPNS